MFNVSGLVSGYGQSEVIHQLDLSAAAGEIVAVMGRNGMGKTTFFKSLMGSCRAVRERSKWPASTSQNCNRSSESRMGSPMCRKAE